MRTMSYTGGDLPEGVMIADQTNPWIEITGTPLDWTLGLWPRVQCPCEENGMVVMPGVLDGMDTPTGIQRCDACDTYDGDLEAALALANKVGGIVKFEVAEE